MSSKHILGIGQLAPGKVVIIHGNTLECDHARPIATLEECEECLKAAQRPKTQSDVSEAVQHAEMSL